MNAFRLVDSFWQDIRFGLRVLRKNPTFAIVAILTLALGTGANAAIFELMNAVRLRKLPVEQAEQLVSVGINTHDKGRTGRSMGRRPYFTEPLWRALAEQQTAFSDIFTWGVTTWNIGSDGEYRPAQGLYVSGTFFEGFRVKPWMGRLISTSDDQKDCSSRGAVLTHGFWQARYGGNTSVIGQKITLDGHAFDIIGIAPPSFFGPEVGRRFDVAVPLCAEPMFRGADSGFGKPSWWFLDIMGRLKPGVTLDAAGKQLAAISPGIFQSTVPPRFTAEDKKVYLEYTLTATDASTGVSNLRRNYATQLWVLLGATALVLLITCANLANLMLARATAREREVAVRMAIGASRWRLVRQMLAESLLLAAFGAIGGAILARWLSETLVAFMSTENVRLFIDLSPDWRSFAFISMLALFACLFFGLSPALRVTANSPIRAIQSGGRSNTDSEERFALRRGLVVVQVALSLVLVIGALLFARSLQNLVNVDPGFRPQGIIVVDIDMRQTPVAPEGRRAMFDDVLTRVRAVPGVERVGETYIVPLSGSGWNQQLVVDGAKRQEIVFFNRVNAEFFTTMETRLIAGRTFGPEDRAGGVQTAVVNQTFVKQLFPNENPIGRRFRLDVGPGDPNPEYQIVGIVEDTKYRELREDTLPISYLAMSQETSFDPGMALVVRTSLPESSVTPTLTRAVREAAPNATIAYSTIRRYISDGLVIERMMTTLAGFFGGLALLIATIGLYGVLSYTVSRRRVEIGIRMALGADPGGVVRMVLGESSRLVIVGVVIGTALAVLTSRWASSLLFGLKPWDPLSIGVALAALGAVSLAAAWIPARRASRVEPTEALRSE